MLSFFTDAALTRPVSLAMPKLFCVPEEGGTRTSTVYIGDAYTAQLAANCASTDTVLHLDQTTEFLPQGGTATIHGTQFSYTGITSNTLTGVSGLSASFSAGLTIKPNIVYLVPGDFVVGVAGSDAVGPSSQIKLSIKTPSQQIYGFPGTPVLLNSGSLLNSASIVIEVQLTVPAGPQNTFLNLELLLSGFVRRAAGNLGTIDPTEQLLAATCLMKCARANLGLTLYQRLFPKNRQVSPSLPGWVVGQYLWRDEETTNAVALVPTNWNADLSSIPASDYVSGIGDGSDLKPVLVEEYQNSLYLRIEQGFYWNGPVRSYLPSAARLEILATSSANVTATLQQSPAPQSPIYVGTWALDQNGAFTKATQYRYCGKSFDTTKTDNQFTIHRSTGAIALNNAMTQAPLLLGMVSGDAIDYFNIPVYPVASVASVYIDRGVGISHLTAPSFTFDQSAGTVHVPNIAGSVAGQPIFAVCSPAVAVLYSQSGSWKPGTLVQADMAITVNGFIYRAQTTGLTGSQAPAFVATPDQLTQDGNQSWNCEGPVNTLRATADLNPAFAGISQGYLYLAQGNPGAYSIALSCDKGRLPVPAAFAALPGVEAFGPIYYDGDYSLLMATVLDSNGNPVPNIELTVVPGSNFVGQINYQDPVANPITIRSGGNGVANMIYTPKSGFGYYLAESSIVETTVAGDTVLLPTLIPVSELYAAQEGWLVTIYQVKDDNPYFGVPSADTAIGQILFKASGTPGTTSYQTNGRRVACLNSSNTALSPVNLIDNLGNAMGSPGFTGLVSKIVYGQAIPTDSETAAYFISYPEDVTLYVQAQNSSVSSNSIVLEMAPPPVIADTVPFLILDSTTSGTLDVQRLGYAGAPTYFPGTALL